MPNPNLGLNLSLNTPEEAQAVSQVVAEDNMRSDLGEFDGQQFLADHGLQLRGVGSTDGEVEVSDAYGNQSTLNIREVMAKSGLNPMEYNVTLNTPETAINKSPVGFGDRIRLALGNAKGQINYLKANYQDATLRDGQLYVKDRGVWHTVDPRGLGDGNGWDLAKELAGDIVDLTKDVAVGAGQVVGAGAGVAAGPVGSIAGAATGAAVASAGMAALGRIVGTYDATAEEVVKDIGLDFVLGAAGEGVAMGAKEAVIPAIGRSLQKLADSKLPQPVRNMLASVFNQTSGVSEESLHAAFDPTKSATISGKLTKFAEEASKPVTLGGEAGLFDEAAAQSFAAGSQEAIDAVARKNMVGAVKTLAGVKEGGPSARTAMQRQLSAKFEGEVIGSIAERVPADALVDLRQPVATHWGQVTEALRATGALADGSQTALKSVPELANQLGMTPAEAGFFKHHTEAYLGSLERMSSDQSLTTKGAEGIRTLFKTLKDSNDIYSRYLGKNESLKNAIGGAFGDLHRGLMAAANFDITLGNGAVVNASSQVAKAQQWYGMKKAALETLADAIDGNTSGIEGLLNRYIRPSAKELGSKEALEHVASFMPFGQEAFADLATSKAAAEFAKAAPKGAIGSSVPRATLGLIGGATLGPIGAAAGIVASSPKLLFKSITASHRGLNMAASMLRSMPEASRRAILMDPEKMAALLGAGIGGQYDPTSR